MQDDACACVSGTIGGLDFDSEAKFLALRSFADCIAKAMSSSDSIRDVEAAFCMASFIVFLGGVGLSMSQAYPQTSRVVKIAGHSQ